MEKHDKKGFEDFHKRLAETLNYLTKTKKLTREEIADKLGTHPGTPYDSWIGKKVYPKINDLVKLTELSGQTIEYLVFGDEGDRNSNLILTPRTKHSRLYAMLDEIVNRGDAEEIDVTEAGLRGVLLMLGEKDEQRKMMERIEKKLDLLLELGPRPKKKPKEPAPEAGE